MAAWGNVILVVVFRNAIVWVIPIQVIVHDAVRCFGLAVLRGGEVQCVVIWRNGDGLCWGMGWL